MKDDIIRFFVGLAQHNNRNNRETMKMDTRYIPDLIRQEVLERDGYRCKKCGSPSYLELDHIIPRRRGGATSARNLQVLCRECNRKKGSR
jgi:5-methylcytosine-specific restriction endonuclease McrA